MVGVIVRLSIVAFIAVGAVAGALYLRSSSGGIPAPGQMIGADGQVIADDSGFAPVPGFNNDGTAPHELISYDLPEPTVTPPLSAGAEALSFRDLWADGESKLDAPVGDRVGTPSESTFEEGVTAEDMMNFFLDMSDMRSMQAMVGSVRGELDGKRVRLAGYTSPVGFEQDEKHFLLVPVLGACIHVPPPPPNQIVYVDSKELAPPVGDMVWVTGTLRTTPVATILADVGYRLEDVTVEAYR